MVGKTDKNVETRKSWVAPVLKKTSIEEITASSRGGLQADGGTGGYSHDS